MLPPLVKLATSAVPGEAKYVCLAGAGLSKDAGLPTAWDLMLATAALLRVHEPDSGDSDIQTWFLSSRFKDMSYSELIGGMFASSVEQQSFVREKLRAERPGKAHLLLAELARRKVLRCIITTNFDDLIERALTDAGLSVQVISNDDDLDHSEPLIHCKDFRVYKPHGTIGVGRLRNTPADLERLSKKMERELVQVLRDHGLMVLGYSGSDESILKVFRKRKHRFYPTFWVNPSEPPASIPPLFASETFVHVPCKGASAVLTDLLDTYRRLMALAPKSGVSASVMSVRQAVQEGRPDASAAVREFFFTLVKELDAQAPDLSVSGQTDELLLGALDAVKPLVVEFGTVAKAVAESGASEPARVLYKGFDLILERYHPAPGVSGSFYEHQFDFYKFLGHELFVMAFAALIREERWQLVKELLEEGIYVRNAEGHRADLVHFEYVSEYLRLLEHRNHRLGLRRVSLHSDLLKDRHTEGELAEVAPHEFFMEAEYFLAMRSMRDGDEEQWEAWRAWSVLHMPGRGPRFLIEAKSKKAALRLCEALGLSGVEQLRERITSTRRYLSRLFQRGLWTAPPSHLDLSEIGSR
jgi:hypothetical protein